MAFRPGLGRQAAAGRLRRARHRLLLRGLYLEPRGGSPAGPRRPQRDRPGRWLRGLAGGRPASGGSALRRRRGGAGAPPPGARGFSERPPPPAPPVGAPPPPRPVAPPRPRT